MELQSAMSGRYEYANVPEEWKEFVKRELNENTSQVNAHIESLAKWVKSMPHLNCPTDANFLLKFLRVAKFDHAKAQMRLDNFCTLRSSPRGSPHFLKLLNVDDPIVEQYLNTKIVIPLGVIESGEMVVLFRFHCWNPDVFEISNFVSLIFMLWNILMMDEATQIFGVISILDMENMSRKSIMAMSDPKDVKAAYRIMQDSFPLRIKRQVFYKEPVIFDVVFKIINFFMREKLKNRTFRLSDDIEKAEKQIPGILKVLPKDYNGEGDTLNNIAGRWNHRFREFYKNDHLFANIYVDESKRPPETSKYLADFPEYNGETLGKVGTFTKFENTF